jgi:hypothetical protein
MSQPKWLRLYLLGRYGGWAAQQELWGYAADQILILHLNDEDEQGRMQLLMEQFRDFFNKWIGQKSGFCVERFGVGLNL